PEGFRRSLYSLSSRPQAGSIPCKLFGNPCTLCRHQARLRVIFSSFLPPYTFSTLTIKAFVSGIIVLASPIVGVRRFELSPPPPPSGYCQPKHQGSPTWCTVVPAI